MRSESMDTVLDILEPVVNVNDYGSEDVTYQKTVTVYAERVKMTGKRAEVICEHFPSYSAAFDTYIFYSVQENWRVQEHGGYLYTVTNIIKNKSRDLQTLVCERVNE